jgi:predicted nucleic acid-binding Zn ribbon protein
VPIFIYSCVNGHEVEFLKLSKDEPEPKRCKVCRKKLEKQIGGTSWQWTRGKNKNWPIHNKGDGDDD